MPAEITPHHPLNTLFSSTRPKPASVAQALFGQARHATAATLPQLTQDTLQFSGATAAPPRGAGVPENLPPTLADAVNTGIQIAQARGSKTLRAEHVLLPLIVDASVQLLETGAAEQGSALDALVSADAAFALSPKQQKALAQKLADAEATLQSMIDSAPAEATEKRFEIETTLYQALKSASGLSTDYAPAASGLFIQALRNQSGEVGQQVATLWNDEAVSQKRVEIIHNKIGSGKREVFGQYWKLARKLTSGPVTVQHLGLSFLRYLKDVGHFDFTNYVGSPTEAKPGNYKLNGFARSTIARLVCNAELGEYDSHPAMRNTIQRNVEKAIELERELTEALPLDGSPVKRSESSIEPALAHFLKMAIDLDLSTKDLLSVFTTPNNYKALSFAYPETFGSVVEDLRQICIANLGETLPSFVGAAGLAPTAGKAPAKGPGISGKDGKSPAAGKADGSGSGKFKEIIDAKERFSDVAGQKMVIENIKEYLELYTDSLPTVDGDISPIATEDDDVIEVDVDPINGILLYGEPGTGKTLTAKAIAGEAGVPFLSTSGSSFLEEYVGTGVKNLNALQNRAIELADQYGGCIIFIDEFEAIAKKRGGHNSHESREETLNHLLTMLDGFNEDPRILWVAATNRKDMLDPAILRPERFSLQLEVPPPNTKKARLEILELYAKRYQEKNQLADDIDLEALAENFTQTNRGAVTGADLKDIINKAAMKAKREKASQIKAEHINSAILDVSLGEKDLELLEEIDEKPEEHKLVMGHEGPGHALAAMVSGRRLFSVSAVPRGGSLGHVMHVSDSTHIKTRREYLKDIYISTAGRAMEEMLLEGDYTSGWGGDLKSIKQRFMQMMVNGLINDDIGNYDEHNPTLSEKDAKLQNKLVRAAIDTHKKVLSELFTPQQLQDATEKLYALGENELIGTPAQTFMKELFSHVDWKRAEAILDEFLNTEWQVED